MRTARRGEVIKFSSGISIKIIRASSDTARLRIEAPKDVKIVFTEDDEEEPLTKNIYRPYGADF